MHDCGEIKRLGNVDVSQQSTALLGHTIIFPQSAPPLDSRLKGYMVKDMYKGTFVGPFATWKEIGISAGS